MSKIIVAGHVRIRLLHPDDSDEVFFDGESHWYIDGSVERTGRVSLLRYDVASGNYEELRGGPGSTDG